MTGLAATLAEERAIMDEFARDYRRWPISGSLVYELERRAFAAWMMETLTAAGGDLRACRVLDVGCGTGELLEELAHLGCRSLTGLDLSEAMAVEARKGVPGAAIGVGALEEHELPPASFDVVTAAFTIHHLFDPAALFAAAADLVPPGGHVFVLDFNRDAWSYARRWPKLVCRLGVAPVRFLVRWKNRRERAAQPVVRSRFNPSHRLHGADELEALARAHGFETVRVTRGMLRPWFVPDLAPRSRFDRRLLEVVGAVEDRITRPDRRSYVWLAGRRRR